MAHPPVPNKLPEIVVLVLAAVLLFYNLGANSLHDHNESGHALVAWEMAESEEWLTLSFQGEPYFKKSPLKFWLTAITYRLFGINEWTARIWSALFAFGTILLLMIGGNALFGPRSGTLAAFVLVTTHQYLFKHCARTGDLDSALVFFFTASVILLLAAIDRQSSRLLYLSFLAIGLSGLVKHLAVIPELLLIVGLTVAVTGAWKLFSVRVWAMSVAISMIVVLPWTVHQVWLHGDSFLAIHFGRELVQRAAEGLPGSQPSRLGAWFYLDTFKNGMFPWSLLLPFAIWCGLGRSSGDLRRRNLVLAIWVAVVFAIPMFSTGQAFRYILPAYPAVAILVGQLLNRLLAPLPDRFAIGSTALALLVALLSTTSAFSLDPFKPGQKKVMLDVGLLDRIDATSLEPGTWLMVSAGFLLTLTLWRHRARPWVRFALLTPLAAVALAQVLPALRFSERESAIDRAVSAAELARGDGEVVWTVLSSRLRKVTIHQFYLRRLEPRAAPLPTNPRAVVRRLDDLDTSLLLLTSRSFAQKLEDLPEITRTASIDRLGDPGGYAVLRITPK